MIDKKTLNHINELLDQDKFDLELHAEMDILKQGYNWSKDFIKKCLKEGKIYREMNFIQTKKKDIKGIIVYINILFYLLN